MQNNFQLPSAAPLMSLNAWRAFIIALIAVCVLARASDASRQPANLEI